jgi:FKBP-type peptidyl-prolyl cis-trans isomerase
VRRPAVGLVWVLLFVLTGCGGGGGGSATAQAKLATLSDITVSGPMTRKPEVSFKAPLRFAKTTSTVLHKGPGRGDAVEADSVVTVGYIAFNASDGTQFDSSWTGAGTDKLATFPVGSVIRGFGMGLQGAHAGDRVLIGVDSKDGYDPVGNGTTIHKGDSLIFVVDVKKVVNPVPIPRRQLPTLVLNRKHQPEKFVAKPSTPPHVSELGVYVVRKGHGPKVTAGQTVTVEYIGQIYPDGKVFDESWSKKAPVSFPIGTGHVIAGWDQGLVGQRIGSRVILTIPSAEGYGATGNGSAVPPNSDLIFAVDLVSAS